MTPKVLIFDLDGTLAPTRPAPMPEENARALCGILECGIAIAVISGSDLAQITERIITRLPCARAYADKIYVLPTSGARMYRWTPDGPNLLHEELLTDKEKKHVFDVLERVAKNHPDWLPEKTYGPRGEDRGTQISFAALGRDAPRELKEKWDPDAARRKVLVEELAPHLEGFSFTIGGTSTIDITRKGIDKAYGVTKLLEHTGLTPDEAIFIGDGIFPGGNDYEVLKSGVKTISVNGPSEIHEKLAQFSNTAIA